MTVEELKEWMDERFTGLNARLDKLNGKVTSHDRWLWLIKGVGMTTAAALGCLGIKVKFF